MKKIAIIDYGLGNIFSIKQALLSCDADVKVTDDPDLIGACDAILLPGVGAFADAMKRLKASGLDQVLTREVNKGKPLLGVCLGMQLLFEKSEEFGQHEGLGFIPGRVVKFPHLTENGITLNVPFIGWNRVQQVGQDGNHLFRGIANQEKFYFVHSYHVVPDDQSCVIANCRYLTYSYPAVVTAQNIVGIQGHPEKSSKQGLIFYNNWLKSL